MKRMKSILKLSLLVLLCGALMFAFACGDKQTDDPNKDQPNPDGPSTDVTPPADEKIDVTIDLADGSVPTVQKVKKGEKLDKPYDPSRTGFTFKGWQKDGKDYDFNTAVESAFTITAIWEMDPAVVPEVAEYPGTVKAAPYAGGSVEVKVKETRGYSYTFKWYINDKDQNSGGTLLEGETAAGAALPRNLEKGKEYWVYCEITGTRNASGASASCISDTIKVEVEDRTISVLMIGSGVMHRSTSGAEHDSALFLQTLARASGKGVTVDKLTVGSNYNIWESGLVGDGYLTVQAMYEIRQYDFVVLQLGRDYCLVPGSGTRNSDFAAISNIYSICKEMNPGVTIVPMISYARQDTTSKYYTDPYVKHDPVVTNREEHAQAIQMYWDEKNSLLEMPYLLSDMNTLFEACLKETDINPWGNDVSDFADMNGSYLMACALYATIFDESPVGVMCFDAGNYSVDPAIGVQLQALAAKQVLGVETETLPDVSGYVKYVDTWVDPDAPVDPKSLDPAYKYPTPTELSTYKETEPTETMEVVMFGGYPIGVYNLHNSLVELMEAEENKKVNLTITYLGHSSESTTYNIFELFESSARTDMNNMSIASYGEKLYSAVTSKKVDYLIIQSGRDLSMENDNYKTGNIVSATKFAMLAAQQNPDVKVIIYAPYGHNANFADFYSISNLEQHVPFINAEAEAIKDSIVNGGYLPEDQVKIAYVSDAFLNYSDNPDDITNDLYQKKNVIATRANTGNRATEAGAYLAAATIYATIYDKSPVGMTYSGFAGSTSAPGVVTDGAKLFELQKVAHKTVFGTEYEGTMPESTLHFYTNGGSEVKSITAPAGSVIEAPADPTNGDLLFAGWFYDPDFTTRFSFMFDTMPLGEVTIYGAWANKDGIPAVKPTDKKPAPTFTMPTDDTAPVTAAGDTLNVWSFGGQMFGSYNMIGTLVEMIKEGTDKEVIADIDSYLGHSNGNTTWNLYELFDSSVRTKIDEIKFTSSGAGTRVEQELTNNAYDVLIIQMGRDFSLIETSTSYNNNVIAVRKIAKLAAAKNPNVKILLVAPYGHTATWEDFTSIGLDNHAKHVKFINYEAVRAYEALKADGIANVEIVSIGNLFECYSDSEMKIYQDLFRAPDSATTRANVGNRATAQGSYLAAAGIYAAMFDKSPEGLTTLGKNITDSTDGTVTVKCEIDAATAAAMQKLAAEYVLGGKVPTEKPDEKVTVEVVVPGAPDVTIEKDTTAPVSTAGDTIKVWAFGGQMMGSYNMTNTLLQLIKEGTGKQASVEGTWLDHNNGNTTWNVYELFDSNARNNIDDMTFGSSASAQKVSDQLNNKAYDCVIIQTGRDFSLPENNAQYKTNVIAVRKIARLAAQQNPDVKIIILAPYGHQTAWGDFTSIGINNHANHVKYINAEAVRAKDAILADGYATNVEIVSIGDLFESYSADATAIATDLFRPANDKTDRSNTANRASAQGSYLTACAIYSAMFDKSCVGLTSNGYNSVDADGNVTLNCTIDAATMTAMQTLAAGFVNGDITPVDKPDVPGGTTPSVPSVPSDVPDETVEGAVNLFVFGGQAMGSYGMMATLEDMIAEETGKNVVTHIEAYLGHSNGSTTWNVWELFSSNAQKSATDMTFGTSATCQKAEQKLKSVKFDYVIIQTGRDLSLVQGGSRYGQTEYAAAKIAKMAYAKNPNVKIILVAPYGHQATFDDFTNPVITNHATHVKYIDQEAASVAGYIKSQGINNVEVISLGSLFEAYSTDANVIRTELFREADTETGRKNVGNRANEKGTYLAACGIFAAMFDKSPVGLQVLGAKGVSSEGVVTWNAEMDSTTAGELQAFAAKIVTGEIVQPKPIDPKPQEPEQVEDTTVEGAVNMYVFGGMTMGSYNMTDTLIQMIEAGQNKPVNLVKAIPTHATTWSTYNMYELFASSARTSETDATLSSTDTKNGFASTRFDYIVLQSGRDFSINSESSKTQVIYSAYKLAKLAYDKNPNVKVIIVAPYGHQATYDDFTNVQVTNHAEHAKLIDAEANEIAQFIKDKGISNVEVVSIASLFESYSDDANVIKTDLFREADAETGRKNVGNRATAKGSYLAACAIYAAMFDESPVGVGALGSNVQSVDATVDVDTAIAMQKLATKFVLNQDVEAKTTFTVSFNTYGGTEIEAVTAEMGTDLTAPEAPTKEGHVFKGWYTDFNYSNEFSFEGAKVPYGGLSLHARWITEKEASRPEYWVEPNATEYEGKDVTVLLIGSISMAYTSSSITYDASQFLSELLDKGGYNAEVRSYTMNGAWNVWESGFKGENYGNIRPYLSDGEVDVVIIQVGRDYAITASSTATSDITAIKDIANLAKAYNPNVKVVLDVQFARQDTSTSYYTAFNGIGVTNRAEHTVAINKFVKEKVLPAMTFDTVVMSLNNAFESSLADGINPWAGATSDFASVEGSYLTACCMYAAITGKSPVGLLRFESDDYSVLPTVGAKLQAIAAETVLDLENVEPVSVSDDYKERTSVNIFVAGNTSVISNEVATMLKNIADELGKDVNVTAHANAGSIEQLTADVAFKNLLLYDATIYDYVIVEAGKDAVLYDDDAFKAESEALKAIRDMAQQNNPESKVMLVAPMARQNTTGQYYRDQVENNGIASRADYTTLIETNTAKLAGETDGVISFATAVEACIAQGVNPYANSISDNLSFAGSYLAACSIYAEIFQATPVTANYVPAGIAADQATAIQNAAVMAILG